MNQLRIPVGPNESTSWESGSTDETLLWAKQTLQPERRSTRSKCNKEREQYNQVQLGNQKTGQRHKQERQELVLVKEAITTTRGLP